MIPALIVPVLNRYDLLQKMLRSIDYPIGRVLIIDNGNGLASVPGAQVVSPGWNLGVGASWNLGMKATPTEPWWCIVNADIEFGPGDLERLDQAVDHTLPAIYFMLGMAAFALTRATVRAIGYFDENFHPAYDEDLDYARRLDLLGLPRVEIGFSGSHVGSATIRSDPEYRAQNGLTHQANDLYYARKWGGPKEGGETFSTPFNLGGHVADWRLDPDRLAAQRWKKET